MKKLNTLQISKKVTAGSVFALAIAVSPQLASAATAAEKAMTPAATSSVGVPTQMGRDARVSQLIGKDVRNSKNEDLGISKT